METPIYSDSGWLAANLDGNNARFQGCAALAANNWKELKKISLCWALDKTDAVDALILVAVNSSKSALEVDCRFSSVWKQEAEYILRSRFSQV